jgi:hypothetical protein
LRDSCHRSVTNDIRRGALPGSDQAIEILDIEPPLPRESHHREPFVQDKSSNGPPASEAQIGRCLLRREQPLVARTHNGSILEGPIPPRFGAPADGHAPHQASSVPRGAERRSMSPNSLNI